MEPKIIKHQRGYLLIVAIIAIVVIGFIASILVSMYASSIKSTTNVLQSQQALYIAKAGLEIARRDLLKDGSTLTCNTLNIPDSCYPPGASNCLGRFSVTGSENVVTPDHTITSNISDSATVISLNSVTNLLPKGLITIDDEVIWYSQITGLQLQGVKRGVSGTTASQHLNSAPAAQNVCTLTSTAGVPTLTGNPNGKRILKEMIWKKDVNNSGGVGSLPGIITPVVVAVGYITLLSTSDIINPTVTIGSEKFPMSTIVSGGAVTLSNASHTKVGPAGTTIASSRNNFLDDISQNNSNITLDKLWGYFFFKSKTELKNDPSTTIISNCGAYNFDGASGTLWLTCNDFNPATNDVIGSVANPVTLISEQNVFLNHNFTINGIFYIMGNLRTQRAVTINGLTATEGYMRLRRAKNSYFNYQILEELGLFDQYNRYYTIWEDFE
ncbi:MAG: hypothetical protein KKE11_00330 [Gammaproteobacteria bacterium]|nr:hypothetical protein [Gammaproteobacteria bacterium]